MRNSTDTTGSQASVFSYGYNVDATLTTRSQLHGKSCESLLHVPQDSLYSTHTPIMVGKSSDSLQHVGRHTLINKEDSDYSTRTPMVGKSSDSLNAGRPSETKKEELSRVRGESDFSTRTPMVAKSSETLVERFSVIKEESEGFSEMSKTKTYRDRQVETFLREYHFPSVNSPAQPPSNRLSRLCCGAKTLERRDEIYPIHLAARMGSYETVLLLLEAAADPQRRAKGRSAMDFAEEESHDDIVLLLREVAAVEETRARLKSSRSTAEELALLQIQPAEDQKNARGYHLDRLLTEPVFQVNM